MKIIILTILALIIIATFFVFYLKYRLNHISDNGDLESKLDLEVKKISKDTSNALVIGIYKDGKTFIKGYGALSHNSTTVPDGTTIFQLASVSKILTASTYQILSDENVFDMDATLNDVIGVAVELSPQAKSVTLRQLATHTSGFPGIPKTLEREAVKLVEKENLMENPYGYLGSKHIFDYLKTTVGKREPCHFEYSNFGMGLLGHVMEVVTKQDLESLVKEKLLTQLNMQNTAIILTPEMKEHLAQGYIDNGKPAPLWTFSSLAGAGAFNSNVDDMMKFVRANIEIENSPIHQSLVRTHKLQLSGKTSIGWMQPTFMDRFFGNKTTLWHNGRVGGYASYISIDIENKMGLVILSNTSADITMLGMMLTRQVRTQSFSK